MPHPKHEKLIKWVQSSSKILSVPDHPFLLVESHDPPSDESGWKEKLSDNDAFDTPFVGSSEQDCQTWLLKKQTEFNYIEPNILGIADARTAKDGTISMHWYHHGEGWDIKPYGVLPPKPGSWYEFRIKPENAARLLADLNFVEPDVVYEQYFGHPEDFTDGNGVFDPKKI
jgi:hypothetical protein